jgi:hypothetical protein
MANFQALLIATQLPLDGAAGRLRPSLTTARGEPGRFFEFSATKCQLVPRLGGTEENTKARLALALARGVSLAQEARHRNTRDGRPNERIHEAEKR